MSGNGNQVPLVPSQRGPGQYPRASTPHRAVECYHTTGASGGNFMPNATGGSQPTAPAALRVQTAPQPSAPPAPTAPQQDIQKNSMGCHNYVSQNQTQQPRQQYQNFQYRATQHGTRPNTHPRQQQQPYIPGTTAATGPVMFPVVFPSHMGLQTYQSQRSNAPYHYPYLNYVQSYNSPSSHTTPYYFASPSPQLPTPNSQTGAQGRNSTPLGGSAAAESPPASNTPVAMSQAPLHYHQTLPGIRPPAPKRSHRIPIINPHTNQEIFSEYPNDNYVGSESDRGGTPQPEPTHSAIEEFNRKINEAAQQSSEISMNNVTKNMDMTVPVMTPSNEMQSQINAINSNTSNNILKSEILNIDEIKKLGSDISIETTSETPVVSAISDNPVIVPKMLMSNKQIQKTSEQIIQSIVIDTDKNIPPNNQFENKNVPQDDDRPVDNTSPVQSFPVTSAATLDTPSSAQISPEPVVSPTFVPMPMPSAVPAPISATDPPLPPQPQSIKESKERNKSEEKDRNIPPNEPEKEPDTTIPDEPSSTEFLQDLPTSIEKLAKEPFENRTDVMDTSSTIEAQAKLTQSLSSVLKTETIKDLNLNNQLAAQTDVDKDNGNPLVISDSDQKDVENIDDNKNEKAVKNTKNANKKSSNKTSDTEVNTKNAESYENGKDETDEVNVANEKANNNVEETETKQPKVPPTEEAPSPPVFVPKYKYSEDQWSPLNKTGKKCYDVGLLKQIKEDPISKNKPNVPLLEACNIIRLSPLPEPQSFSSISRPNDTFFHPFAKPGIGPRNTLPRDPKKDNRAVGPPSGKGSGKMAVTPSGSSSQKPIIHVSLSLREEVKLSEVDSAWKPTRFRKDNITENEFKTQELYKKFRGILNKLTPEKFDTLLDKVKHLEINDRKRLEGVIDLVFEKAIDEPNFSEAYAAMCNKLSMLKVPADNPTTPDQCVNFRALIINKCQKQFETDKVDEHVLKLEKELSECTDPVKKKELHLMLEEENRRVRMRSVGNVRFIGELYKLKMLTCKIMEYCMKYLIDKVEEEKLECLCKLLTTIGEQVENESQGQLDSVFKKMQDIVDRKSNKISSRVRFMIQDVIALRKRKWVTKSVVDSQPKTMNQIQKEAEQQQRHIELMNANPMGGNFRREDGGRNKRGDSRRQNSNNAFMDSTWKAPRTNYSVDMNKLKAVTQKNLSNIKLAPAMSAWNHGSGTKNPLQTSSNSMISINKNTFILLDNTQADPTSLRDNRDMPPSYHSKGASIERSTFDSKNDYGTSSGRSGSVGGVQADVGSRGASGVGLSSAGPALDAAVSVLPPAVVVPQEPLPENKVKTVKSILVLCLINASDEELIPEIKLLQPQHHAAIIAEIINFALEKAAKEADKIASFILPVIATGTIAPENLIAGMKDTFEFAPDLHIDIPMLYEFLGKFISPHIEKKHITFGQIFKLCDAIIASNHGHLFLRVVFREMLDSMGPNFIKTKWNEANMQLSQWMPEDQVPKWIAENKFEFLDGDTQAIESAKIILTPSETQKKLLQLMNSDESCDCIKGWVQDKIGKSSNEDWFMRALIQAICEHALFRPESRDIAHFNQDRMNKYASLIHEFGETKQAREASCLFGIQQLIHRLEHPQGLTLDIFQYLHEQYIISLDGFIAWEESEKEPEGKGVMMKALTSFFTNIKEADNEDSCSED